MMKTLAALALLATLAAATTACNGDNPEPARTSVSAAAPAAPTTSAAAASPAPSAAGAGVRAQACRDILPLLDELRALDPASATQTAESTITNMQSTPGWNQLSQADRDATIAGIRDAAAGKCV